MERWQGKPLDIQHIYTNWDNQDSSIAWLFEQKLPQIWQAGKVPLVSWEPFTPTPTATPDDIVTQIANGKYDSYLKKWTSALHKSLDETNGRPRRLYLRFAHEMNGDWYPWGVGNSSVSPEAFIEMWTRVHRFLTRNDHSPSQLRTIWCVNHRDVNASMEQLYPGDDYVDWVAVDGFNWGATKKWASWSDPVDVFGEMIQRLRNLSDKPLAITEFGSTSITEHGPQPTLKAKWLKQAISFFRAVDAKMLVTFNVDKETDWAIFGGRRGEGTLTGNGQTYHVYPSYANALSLFNQS